MTLHCDHPWFKLSDKGVWECTVCGWSRRAAAIDEAVRRITTKGGGKVILDDGRTRPCSFCTLLIRDIRAEFARIMSQDDLESAGNGMGMR